MNSLFLIRTTWIKQKLPVNKDPISNTAHCSQESKHLETNTLCHCRGHVLDLSHSQVLGGLPTGFLSCQVLRFLPPLPPNTKMARDFRDYFILIPKFPQYLPKEREKMT